jgi:predicted metal-dependent HD superfamily phosphohydrolase
MSLITESIKSELSALYSSPTRFYHSMGHVSALLELHSRYRTLLTHPYDVEAAIWFHDAIYDSKEAPPTNELRSAELAEARLTNAGVDPVRVKRIYALIEATAKHQPGPELSNPEEVVDADLFLDMDLSILGADEKDFDQYERDVREEYAWVSDEAWRTGRAKVLTGFAEREYIFRSMAFRQEYEEKARKNIDRSLRRLQSRDSDSSCPVITSP